MLQGLRRMASLPVGTVGRPLAPTPPSELDTVSVFTEKAGLATTSRLDETLGPAVGGNEFLQPDGFRQTFPTCGKGRCLREHRALQGERAKL